MRKIFSVSEMPSNSKKLYGLFPSVKKAKEAIQSISDEHSLCYQVCGLEKTTSRACTSHQLKKCKGYCTGKQSALIHNLKLLQGFSALSLKTWPYKGPIALVEKSENEESAYHLLIDNWCILGVAESAGDYEDILTNSPTPQIDKDIYRYLVATIFAKNSSVKLIPLTVL